MRRTQRAAVFAAACGLRSMSPALPPARVLTVVGDDHPADPLLLHGAFKRAVRWRWVAVNPVSQAEPPPAPNPDPHPTTAEETARILNEAWAVDPDWGIWLAVTTGARRGELCALRWRHLTITHLCASCGRNQPDDGTCAACGSDSVGIRGVLEVRQNVAKDGKSGWIVKDTKTHQQRRIALDSATVEVLLAFRKRYREQCRELASRLIG